MNGVNETIYHCVHCASEMEVSGNIARCPHCGWKLSTVIPREIQFPKSKPVESYLIFKCIECGREFPNHVAAGKHKCKADRRKIRKTKENKDR
jgi:DNA-directed RNA polymerase subunit RPC12/RpoP